MVLTIAAVEKMPKEELVNMVLNYNKIIEPTLADLNKEISKINKNFEKLESELPISKTVNNALHKRVIQLEKQCWTNEQYSCRECIQVVGLPDSTTDNELCSVFKKIGVNVSVNNIEACHPLMSDSKNKIIVKFSKRKVCQVVLENKKKLKNISNEELGLETNSKVFVNESLCKYYKLLWSQCKSLWNDKMIFAFWTTNGFLKLKFRQDDRVHTIYHLEDLQEYFQNMNSISKVGINFLYKICIICLGYTCLE